MLYGLLISAAPGFKRDLNYGPRYQLQKQHGPDGEESQITACPPFSWEQGPSSCHHLAVPNQEGLQSWKTHHSPEEVTPTTRCPHSTEFSSHIQLEPTNNYRET